MIRRELGTQFCRRCNYCQPCAAGIAINGIFVLEGYLNRYGLGDWAKRLCGHGQEGRGLRRVAVRAKSVYQLQFGRCSRDARMNLARNAFCHGRVQYQWKIQKSRVSGGVWGQSLNRILSGRKRMIDRIDRKREVCSCTSRKYCFEGTLEAHRVHSAGNCAAAASGHRSCVPRARGRAQPRGLGLRPRVRVRRRKPLLQPPISRSPL